MPTLIEKIEFYNEIRDFDTGATNRTSVLKANAGEKVQANIQFRVQIESIANPGNGDEFLVQTISGVTSITSNTADFVANGWRVGDVFTFTDNSGGGIGAAPGQIITLVSGNFMEITLNAPLVPNNYVNADLQLTTELDQLIFQYNFTDLSNQTDLVQQLLQSIQLFEYNGLTDLNFHTGVARQPTRGNTGSSQAKRRIATANFIQFFEVEHDFIVLPAGREDQLSNLQTNSIPDPYRNETVFYKTVIEMGVGGDNARLRPLPLDRVANDSVGWRNENFDGGANIFTVDSFSYSIPSLPNRRLSSIEAKATTQVLATISTTGTFTTTHPVVLHHSYLPEINVLQSTSDDYQTATIFESLRHTIDGGSINGTIITNFTVVRDDATHITIRFDIQYTIDQLTRIFDDGAYELYISLADNSLTAELSNRVALLIDAARLTKNPDITGLVLNETMEFFSHTKDFALGTGNTSIETWIEDGFLLAGSFDLNVGVDLVDIEGLFIEIIAQNTISDKLFVIRSYTIPTITQTVTTESIAPFEQVQVLALDDTQGFLLKAGDQNNFLKISNGNLTFGNQNYGYQIGLKMSWQDWEKLDTVDGSFFDLNELNNGLNKKADRFSGENDYVIKIRQVLRVRKGGIITTYNTTSPEIRVFDYEKDSNPTPDFTGSMVFKDENNNGLSNSVITNENSTVTVTFDDVTAQTDINDFEAIIRIQEKVQGTEQSIHEISSLRGVLSGNLLTPLAGESNTNKSIVSGNFTAKCLVDGTLLIADDYTLSARLFEIICIPVSVNSLSFDGIDKNLDCGTDSSLDFERTDPFSVVFWVNTTDNDCSFFSRSNASGGRKGYALNFEAGVLRFTMGSGAIGNNIKVRTNSTVLRNGSWHQFALTYDGSGSSAGVGMHIDGSSLSTVIETNGLAADISSVQNFTIANDRTRFLSGNMDLTQVFSKELTGSEITELYNDGCTTLAIPASASGNIISTWRMGENVTTGGGLLLTVIDEQGTNTATAVNMEDTDIDTDVPPLP